MPADHRRGADHHRVLRAQPRACVREVAFPLLAVAFVLGRDLDAPQGPLRRPRRATRRHRGFLLMSGATFGYACGWNPYASDYTRYMAPDTKPEGGRACGRARRPRCRASSSRSSAPRRRPSAPTGRRPTAAFTDPLPDLVRRLTLLAIAVGAVAANALNIYSGRDVLHDLGIKIPLTLRRAVVAVVLRRRRFLRGLERPARRRREVRELPARSSPTGSALARGVLPRPDAATRGNHADLLYDHGHYQNWAGPIAMADRQAVSIWLFANQTRVRRLLARHHPNFGDLTFEVGFVLTARARTSSCTGCSPRAARRPSSCAT